jgi:hypothetical protein
MGKTFVCPRKVRYVTGLEAVVAAARRPAFFTGWRPYACGLCAGWHLTSRPTAGWA